MLVAAPACKQRNYIACSSVVSTVQFYSMYKQQATNELEPGKPACMGPKLCLWSLIKIIYKLLYAYRVSELSITAVSECSASNESWVQKAFQVARCIS